MNVLESLLILAATLSALWWAFARHRAPVALERTSWSFKTMPGSLRATTFSQVDQQINECKSVGHARHIASIGKGT
jgi:hypothetical protein